jgi:hypothetical protein
LTALDRMDQAISALGDCVEWAFGVLRPVLPKGLSSLGVRSRHAVLALDPEAGPVNQGTLITSLLGQTRLDRPNAHRPDAAIGVLSEAAQFHITTQLSEAAVRAGRKAIALRLDRLSPIPLEDAAFAVRRVSPPGVLSVEVDVSIARRSDIERACAVLKAQARDWRLVGSLGPDHQPTLDFARAERPPMGLGLKLLLVSAALAVALFAWAGRMDFAALSAESDQANLTRQARAAAEVDRRLDAVALAHQQRQAAPALGDWLEALATLSEGEATFTGIRVADGQVTLEADGTPVASHPIDPPEAGTAQLPTGEAAP